jgi:hypothetical protein
MLGVPLFGELAKLVREIVRLVRQKRLPIEELKQFIADAKVGEFERKQRKRVGED